MRLPFSPCLALALAACGTTYSVPDVGADAAVPQAGTAATPPAPLGPARTRADFARVLARVEPAAERLCRQERPEAPAEWCDYRISLVTDPDTPPNAFQSEGDDGRPEVHFAATLLPLMRSDDEIAFVLAHETGHHIAGHIPKQRAQQALGTMVGGLAAAMGAAYGIPLSQDEGMTLGGEIGARSYSQTYELEADTLGAFITARAGYNPVWGADFFERPEVASAGGLPLLVSHPGSAQREATVARAWAEIQRQRALGLDPTPAPAG